MNSTAQSLLAIVTGIIGVAILAVIVSPKAQTSNVLKAFGNLLSTSIGAAVKPVS